MRPDEVFRIRTENINWSQRLIFNPNGKTRAARRYVPISERMLELLMVRCSDKREGWLFPSPRAKCGHLTTVAKQFREARSKAWLPESLVLYCARLTFGTAARMEQPEQCHGSHGCSYRHAVSASGVGFRARSHRDQRNLRHKLRHNELRVQ
jgi:integrase